MAKRNIIIVVAGIVVVLVAGFFFVVDFDDVGVPERPEVIIENKDRPKTVIDTSCPVQPCFKEEEEEKEAETKKPTIKPKFKKKPWDPFRKPWES